MYSQLVITGVTQNSPFAERLSFQAVTAGKGIIMFAASSLKLVGVGVDYLTVVGHSDEAVDAMRTIAFSLIEVEQSAGAFSRPLGFAGYEGFQTGSVYYGERPDGCVVRIGGHLAAAHYKRLLEVSDNVTRIDLQSTCQLDGDVSKFIRHQFATHRRYSNRFKKAPRPSLFIGRDDSCTMYSGSRSSDRYGRIYDKGVESGLSQWQNCVRFEVEFKGKRARRIAHGLSEGIIDLLVLSHTVWQFFAERGLLMRLESIFSTSLDFLKSSLVRAKRLDCDRLLAWIHKSVRPSISRLKSRGFSGRLSLALGLSLAPEQRTLVPAFP